MKLAKRQGRDLEELSKVIGELSEGKTLETKYKDHELSGNYKGTRECHVEPDFLLVYERNKAALVLMLYRAMTHSELFKK